jgi:hypothetical protein
VLSDPPDRAALRESVLDSDWERVTETYLDLFDRVMR